MSKAAGLALLVSVLAGCQARGLQADVPAPLEPAPRDDVAALVAYGSLVRRLAPEDLEQEYAAVWTRNRFAPSIETAIKLSLLLSHPAAPFYDAERALGLLDEVALRLQSRSDPTAEFSRLLHQLLTEQRRATADSETLRSALAEARTQNRSLTEALAETEARLEDEVKLRRALQEQLDALKALEEQINLDDGRR